MSELKLRPLACSGVAFAEGSVVDCCVEILRRGLLGMTGARVADEFFVVRFQAGAEIKASYMSTR
jgi:hypothetical protein